jgi:hemerythrin-like metal-binding protein
MAQFVEWNTVLALGIPMIDEQHKKLVELCNDLYSALMDTDTPKENKEIIKEAVRACTEYVNYHFSSEEKLLLAAEYEDFAEHKKAHDEFIKRILQAVTVYENADF